MQKSKLMTLLAVSAISFNPKLLKKVDVCAEVSDPKAPMVYVVKQWHLAPSVNTKVNPPAAPLPQEKNQTEIFKQLSEWAEKGEIDTAIAEGCEGEINESLKEAFQGWTFSDLKLHASDKDFPKILSHPVLKLTAKFSKEIHGICGDNLAEIKKAQLALSDARADVGYEERISENKADAAKLKPYLDGVTEMYHLKVNANADEAMKALQEDLTASLKAFDDSTHARDLSFVAAVEKNHSQKANALVVGGLHANDLKKILESKKMNCYVFQPLSYQNDEELLQKKLDSLLKP